MISVECSTIINRPVEEVFDFLSNMENNLKWRASQIEVRKTSAGPIGVGTTYRLVNSLLGRRVELEAEVTEYLPNRKYTSIDKSGTLPLRAQRIFEPVEGGTRVTVLLKAEPGGLFKLADPLLARLVQRRIASDLANAKDLIETGAPGRTRSPL